MLKLIKFRRQCTVIFLFVLTSFVIFFYCTEREHTNPVDPDFNGIKIPFAPKNLTAKAVSSFQVNLTWQDNSNNEIGFIMERKGADITNFTIIDSVAANVTSYQNTGLQDLIFYSYRVCAYNSAGNSDYSNTATDTTPPTNRYTLTVAVSPINGGSVVRSPDQSQYASGTTVSLTASPASGYQFTRWEGDVTGTANPTTVTMNGNKNVTAVFTEVTAPLIQLSTSRLTFTATYGGTAPASQTVNITNGGSGTLSGLSHYFPDGTPTWIFVILDRSTMPAVLTVSVSMSDPFGNTFSAGTYKKRIAIVATNASNSPQYIDVTFTILPQPRGITLQNNMASNCYIHEIVQVKVSLTQSGVFTLNDLLTRDPASALDSPGESISLNQSRSFDITIGDNYSVYIGIGKWETKVTNPPDYPWFKRTYFTDVNWINHYVWVVVNVTNHKSGNWTWTISGSYLNGTLIITPEGNQSIPFNITTYNPIW